jgi:hypothetical protein
MLEVPDEMLLLRDLFALNKFIWQALHRMGARGRVLNVRFVDDELTFDYEAAASPAAHAAAAQIRMQDCERCGYRHALDGPCPEQLSQQAQADRLIPWIDRRDG